MKYFTLLIVSLICLGQVQAQCDDTYFPFKEGVSFEMTSYSAKDKMEGKTTSSIEDGAIDGNNITVSNKTYDKKGDLVAEGDFVVICDDGMIKMDMSQFIPEEMLKQYENMEVSVEGDFLQIPSKLSVGQTLADGNGTMTISLAEGAMNMDMKVDMKFTDRKVEKSESLTTSAGTFDTFKITQTTITTMKMMGMNREMAMSSTSWYAKGVGAVRTENYDDKGKLIGYTVLTKFEE